jgi:hypothetical protein
MSFYDLNVTKPIYKSNGTVNLPNGGTPSLTKITLGGILEKLILIGQGTATYTPGTGSIAQDINGPWNFYNQISLIPNQQVPIIQASGYGLALFNLLKQNLEIENNLMVAPVNVGPFSVDNSYVNSGAIITTPSGTQSPLWTHMLPVPVTQRMFNGIVGYWELGNPLAQLTLSIIPAYTGTASPYNIYSLTAGQQPYLTTGNSTVTLANPTVDIMRYLYDTPINQNDRPPVTFINCVLEDTFQNNVGSAKALNYAFSPLSGYVARVLAYVVDSTTNKGVAPSMMLASNSLTMGVGDGTSLISESFYEFAARQRYELGTDMPQGTFYVDCLGKDLTFQNIFSTYDFANININMNFASALGATSYGKVVKQMLKPLQYTSK